MPSDVVDFIGCDVAAISPTPEVLHDLRTVRHRAMLVAIPSPCSPPPGGVVLAPQSGGGLGLRATAAKGEEDSRFECVDYQRNSLVEGKSDLLESRSSRHFVRGCGLGQALARSQDSEIIMSESDSNHHVSANLKRRIFDKAYH